MTCPIPADFPPPPPGKVGWPWTAESAQIPETMPDGSPWPQVSVVTPSYNQGRFIEETIRSVLLQGYPNLEYAVVDGGSSDGSVDTIRKYEPWLANWVSEGDRGQSHAINKGWKRASGEVLAYLNSDDIYLPESIQRAVTTLAQNPASGMVYSDGMWIDEKSIPLRMQRCEPLDARKLLTGKHRTAIPQPTAFIHRYALEDVGFLDESLQMGMDYDLWLKLALRYPLLYIEGKPLAALRHHPDQKTSTRTLEARLEGLVIMERILADPRCPDGIGRKGNRVNVSRYLDIAGIYLTQKRDLGTASDYFVRALKANPLNTARGLGYRAAKRVYWSLLPESVRKRIRSVRGVDDSIG